MSAPSDILRLPHAEAMRIAESKARDAKWRAKNLGLTMHFSADQFIALIQNYPRCAECGSDQFLTPDHIVPLKNGGTNLIDNIQPLCFFCNSRKAHRSLDDVIIFCIGPSLKARAEAVAAGKNQSLSDYAHDLLEAAVSREERQARRQAS